MLNIGFHHYIWLLPLAIFTAPIVRLTCHILSYFDIVESEFLENGNWIVWCGIEAAILLGWMIGVVIGLKVQFTFISDYDSYKKSVYRKEIKICIMLSAIGIVLSGVMWIMGIPLLY